MQCLYLLQVGQVQVDAIQEALGCDICAPPELLVELFRGLFDTLVHNWEHLGQRVLLLLR